MSANDLAQLAMITAPPTSDETRTAATRAVLAASTDPADASELLAMLGLDDLVGAR